MVTIRELATPPGHYDGPKPPKYLADLLFRIGGRNQYDEPNFRLVWAPARKTASGGVWLTWAQGYENVKDRNTSRGAIPYKREAGIKMINRYGPVQGWALERWVPAKGYGTRQRWYTSAAIGGTMVIVSPRGHIPEYLPSQGEYPARGDYEYTGFSFMTDQLAEATVIPCMQALIQNRESLPMNPQRRIAVRSSIAASAAVAADEAYEKWAMDRIQEAQPAFNGQIMLGAGKKRPHSSNEILKRLKIGSHHMS